jgi:hypothetical protein
LDVTASTATGAAHEHRAGEHQAGAAGQQETELLGRAGLGELPAGGTARGRPGRDLRAVIPVVALGVVLRRLRLLVLLLILLVVLVVLVLILVLLVLLLVALVLFLVLFLVRDVAVLVRGAGTRRVVPLAEAGLAAGIDRGDILAAVGNSQTGAGEHQPARGGRGGDDLLDHVSSSFALRSARLGTAQGLTRFEETGDAPQTAFTHPAQSLRQSFSITMVKTVVKTMADRTATRRVGPSE